jgi:hypothetical protein
LVGVGQLFVRAKNANLRKLIPFAISSMYQTAWIILEINRTRWESL